jgi:hypothetical protein
MSTSRIQASPGKLTMSLFEAFYLAFLLAMFFLILLFLIGLLSLEFGPPFTS